MMKREVFCQKKNIRALGGQKSIEVSDSEGDVLDLRTIN